MFWSGATIWPKVSLTSSSSVLDVVMKHSEVGSLSVLFFFGKNSVPLKPRLILGDTCSEGDCNLRRIQLTERTSISLCLQISHEALVMSHMLCVLLLRRNTRKATWRYGYFGFFCSAVIKYFQYLTIKLSTLVQNIFLYSCDIRISKNDWFQPLHEVREGGTSKLIHCV